jgi:hypothetical protein
MPPDTAGELAIRAPVLAVHSGLHVTTPGEQFLAPRASKAYSLRSDEPTYTTPPTTAGDETTSSPVGR